ncbi:MAG: hypothetical protein IT562_22035 [Alphaproteobacteria bacterium]|nr:hypothetical protein [Alphaproteobacteria bacterium]
MKRLRAEWSAPSARNQVQRAPCSNAAKGLSMLPSAIAMAQPAPVALRAAGTLVVDDGAAAALGKGKSLLPAGVVRVAGDFDRGDAVAVEDKRGKRLGRGLVAYSSQDCQRIIGHKSGEIAAILGYRGRDEMIHRDDLVLDP